MFEREPEIEKEWLEMEKILGEKKVVYRDGDYTKVLKGSCYFEDEFVKVVTSSATVWIGKSAIISIT